MRRPSPILQITLALTLLGCTVLIMAQWMWGLFPDPAQREARWRQAHAESAAAQTLFLVERELHAELGRTLELAAKADSRIRSMGVRRADGTLLARTDRHDQVWVAPADGRSTMEHVLVPIHAGDRRWGQLEMTFTPEERGLLATLARYPLAVALAHFALIAGLLYWLYLRRAMVQLDPASVIPERIRAAYDVMTEGVALLDGHARIVMVNSAFHSLPATRWPDIVGRKLSSLPWLAAGLPADITQHPWAQVLRTGLPSCGHEVRIGDASGQPRRLLVNCAPIADEGGRVRGCLVTFDDVSALQVMNEKLTRALEELQVSKREIERQNRELERLATRDVLSGCLTRGAGLLRGEAAFERARIERLPLCCLLIDIDKFKAVNDGFGHAVGDRVVQRIGATMDAVLGQEAILSRHGGDEFAALLPGLDARAGHAVAERLREAVERLEDREVPGDSPLRVTISIGVASFDAATMTDLPALIAAADEALYEAKALGRNCVRRVPETLKESAVEALAADGQPA